jgi:hypothetical protein
MRSTDSTRTRAAASSTASGMPSRSSQIRATWGALSAVTAKFGRTFPARSVNRRTASECFSDGTRQVVSPPTLSGSRLVATTVTSGQPRSSASASWPLGSRTCSQLSSSTSARRPVR